MNNNIWADPTTNMYNTATTRMCVSPFSLNLQQVLISAQKGGAGLCAFDITSGVCE